MHFSPGFRYILLAHEQMLRYLLTYSQAEGIWICLKWNHLPDRCLMPDGFPLMGGGGVMVPPLRVPDTINRLNVRTLTNLKCVMSSALKTIFLLSHLLQQTLLGIHAHPTPAIPRSHSFEYPFTSNSSHPNVSATSTSQPNKQKQILLRSQTRSYQSCNLPFLRV